MYKRHQVVQIIAQHVMSNSYNKHSFLLREIQVGDYSAASISHAKQVSKSKTIYCMYIHGDNG